MRVNLEVSPKFCVLCYMVLIVSVELPAEKSHPRWLKKKKRFIKQFFIKIAVWPWLVWLSL